MFKRRTKVTEYRQEQTIHWLSWLARSLMRNNESIFYVEKMPGNWLPSHVVAKTLMVDFGLVVGLFFGSGLGLVLGRVFGPDLGLAHELDLELFFGLVGGVVGGRVLGLVLGLIFGLGLGLVGGSAGGLGFVLGLGLSFGLSLGLGMRSVQSLSSFLNPTVHRGLALTVQRAGLLVGLLVGLPVGGIAGLLFIKLVADWNWKLQAGGLLLFILLCMIFEKNYRGVYPEVEVFNFLRLSLIFVGLPLGVMVGLLVGFPISRLDLGLFFGLIIGLAGGQIATPVYVEHYLLRFLLWYNDYAPWRYIRFLDYAAERLFLRKVGGGYIFTHRLLMEYFATLEPTEQAGQDKFE